MHTMLLTFWLLFNPRDPDYLSRYNYITTGWVDALNQCPRGIRLSIHHLPSDDRRLFRGNEIQIFINCIDLFHDPATSKSQIADIRNHLVNILEPLDIDIDEMIVRSIDYCKNFYVPSSEERELLLELWNKTHERFKRAHRIPAELCQTSNKLYWACKGRYNVQIYDKERERQDKGETTYSYDCGLMRLEYQIREKHIDGHYHKGHPRTFDAWADWYLRARYLTETETLFFNGDFYNLPHAKTKLNKAVRAGKVKPVIADRIYQFMVNVSRRNIDYAVSKTSKPTAKGYIDILSKLEINPIPIPKNRGISFLENPLREFYEGGCMA